MLPYKALLKSVLILSATVLPFQASAAETNPQTPNDLEISAKQISCAVPGMICLRVSAINRSATQIYLVNATDAVLTNSGGSTKALPSTEICERSDKQEWQKVRDEQAAVTLVTAGLGTLVVGDIETKKQNPRAWLGRESEDRARTQEMFDERLILQLDHTDGLVYFNSGAGGINTLRLQMRRWPDDAIGNPNANSEITLDVPIDNSQIVLSKHDRFEPPHRSDAK